MSSDSSYPTIIGKLKHWRTMMCMRLPLFEEQGHFDWSDIQNLDEIIELLENNSSPTTVKEVKDE